jgi:hypothetical protein
MTQYIQNAGSEASAFFDKTYSDLVVCFDVDRLYHLIGDEIRISGLPEEVKKNFSIKSLVLETEKAFVRLLDRGALTPIQRFGITHEAEEQIADMRARANARPRGTVKPGGQKDEVTPKAPQSRWANLTQDEFNLMPSRQSKELYKSDADFRAAVDRLSAEDAAKAPSSDTTGRVFLRRKTDQQFFKEWKNGVDYWTPDFNFRAHMVYSEGNRQIESFRQRGVEVEAFEMGNNKLIDFSPKVEAPKAVQKTAEWKLEPSGWTTVSPNQRRHRPGTFLLKSQNGEFVLSIDESNYVVKTISQSGNARAWTSRETAIAAAKSIPGLPFWLFRWDGEPA